MFHPTPSEKAYITAAALEIGTRPDDLNALINFESKYNPTAKNPLSSARGLLQFTNTTARELGFSDSTDLINKNPTFTSQIKNAVIPYLKRKAPFPTQQSLYMSVFYPAARTWSANSIFPANVQAVNPGIRTVQDYINKVNNAKLLPLTLPISIILIVSLIFLFTRKGKEDEEVKE